MRASRDIRIDLTPPARQRPLLTARNPALLPAARESTTQKPQIQVERRPMGSALATPAGRTATPFAAPSASEQGSIAEPVN